MEAVLLILPKDGVNAGVVLEPFLVANLLAAMQFMQSLGVNVEWCVFVRMSLDNPQNLGCHVLGGSPMFFVPLLQYGHLGARYLDAESRFSMFASPSANAVLVRFETSSPMRIRI